MRNFWQFPRKKNERNFRQLFENLSDFRVFFVLSLFSLIRHYTKNYNLLYLLQKMNAHTEKSQFFL